MLNAFLCLGAILVIMAIIGIFAARAARKRQKGLLEVAESIGFQFTPLLGEHIILQLPRFQLFTAGRSHHVSNLLSGATESTQVMIFDWRYVVGSGKNNSSIMTTVMAIESTDLTLPPFYCRPETMLDWLGLTFDGHDIDFADQPAFSQKFHLHGKDEARIRQVFDVNVCEFFEQHEGSYAEGHPGWMLYYHLGKQVAPDKIQAQFKDAFALYVLLKCAAGESAAAISDQSGDEMPPESERQF